MNRIDHARTELQMIGKSTRVTNLYLDTISTIGDIMDEGQGVMEIVETISKLMYWQTLSPLTDSPDEWTNIGDSIGKPLNMWQSTRCPEAFSTDGGKTYYLLSEREVDPNAIHVAVSVTGDTNGPA